MSFRRRLLLLFALTVLLSVATVTAIISTWTRRAFDHANDERTAAFVAQFHKEFQNQGDDVRRRIEERRVYPPQHEHRWEQRVPR